MARKLINRTQVQELYCRETMTFTVGKGMIMSQSALDFAREYQIKVIYSTEAAPSPEKKPSKAELSQMVADLLKKEYGIENDAVLQAILKKLNS